MKDMADGIDGIDGTDGADVIDGADGAVTGACFRAVSYLMGEEGVQMIVLQEIVGL